MLRLTETDGFAQATVTLAQINFLTKTVGTCMHLIINNNTFQARTLIIILVSVMFLLFIK